MVIQRFTDEIIPQLQEWFELNYRSGCSIAQLRETLRSAGYVDIEINQFLKKQKSIFSKKKINDLFDANPITPKETAIDRIWRRNYVLNLFHKIHVGDKIVNLIAKNTIFGVYYLTNFLSDAECDCLIAESGTQMCNSTVIDEAGDGDMITANRSSRGAVLYRGSSSAVKAIESRISKLTDIPLSHGEGLQILNYRIGEEYRPHFDYFDPASAGGAKVLSEGGQRFATIIMYLSDVEAGGGTQFPELGLEFSPIKGAALLFASIGPDGELIGSSLHAGCPVTSGEKWIATKWLRVSPFTKIG